jgi:uncharacterized protein YgiM (DUF1202 family)
MMKKHSAFLILILLTACAPQQPPNAEEQLATIAVKTQAAGQLGTIVAQTLTAHPPAPTAAVSATSEVTGAAVIPTGSAPIITDVIACGPGNSLAYFTIDANTAYRNWEGMLISMNQTRVICSEVPGDTTTLACEMPANTTFPATLTFGLGDGIVGTFTFNEGQCTAAGFAAEMTTVYTNTTAQNVNLRTNPGLLFTVSRVMEQGTRLELRGLSPGGDWAYVQNSEGVSGWVDLNFVQPFPKAQLPVVEPTGVQQISGSVVDANGTPMHGINFSITQGNKRTDAITNALGEFHAYLPTSASGVWTVGYISINAESNAFTPECMLDTDACGSTTPTSVEVTLPTSTSLLFNWE